MECFLCKQVRIDNMIYIDNSIIWYKFAAYVVKASISFPQECYICEACMEQCYLHPYYGAECGLCKQIYQSYDEQNPELDSACSSIIQHDGILGGYGSIYDKKKYTFTDGNNDNTSIGSLICDNCIDKFIKDKILNNIPAVDNKTSQE